MARVLSVLLLLFSAAIYLAGNSAVPLWDRDEPRYALASQAMRDSGDYVEPKLMGEPRLNKPPMIYWLQSLALRMADDEPYAQTGATRMPSVIAMLLLLGVLMVALPRETDGQRARWTVFIFATSAVTILSAKLAMTDAVLCLFVTIAQLCVYQLWRGRHTWPTYALLGVAIGCAGMTKGPVVLGVLGTTLLALIALRAVERSRPAPASIGWTTDVPEPQTTSFKWWHALLCVGLVIVIAAPWVIAIERRHPGYLLQVLNKEIVHRASRPAEGHYGPPGYYLLTVFGTYLPWSLFLPATLIGAWKNRKLPQVRFALAAVVGPWLMFELVSTKLPHYVLPVFPFLAFLSADALVRNLKGRAMTLRDRPFTVTVKVLLQITAGAAGLGIAMLPFMVDGIPVPNAIAAAALVMASSFFLWRFFSRGQLRNAAITMGLSFAVLIAAVYTLLLPHATALHLSRNVGLRAAALSSTHGVRHPAVMIGFKEPSVAFYQGGTIREQPKTYFHMLPPESWPSVVVIDEATYRSLHAPKATETADSESAMALDHYRIEESFEGAQYAGGRLHQRVHILVRQP